MVTTSTTKPARRSYSADDKAQALQAYLDVGPTKACEATGISKSTIRGWAKSQGLSAVRSEKTAAATQAIAADNALSRERLATTLLARCFELEHRFDEPQVVIADGKAVELRGTRAGDDLVAPANACRDIAVTIGICVDKVQLLLGEATERVEHSTPRTEDIIALRDDLAARRGVKAAG
jgi:transposase-like protein